MNDYKYELIISKLMGGLFFTILLIVITPIAHAFTGAPGPADCSGSDGSRGFSYDSPYLGCNFVARDGTNYINNSTSVTAINAPMFSKGYVPYSGKYKIRANICPATEAINCTLAKTTSFVDSINSVEASSANELGYQGGSLGGGSGSIPAHSAICYTFFEITHPEIQWRNSDAINCSDAHLLPSVPADCYINDLTDLNVTMGSLERSEIPTVPDSNSSMAKSVTVSVLCTRDGSTTNVTKFKYTPVSISGNNLVSTKKNGLGIAIYYKGFLVTNGQELPVENFKTGYSYVELTFVPVRDKDTALKDIPTGSFSADAVMEMTEQ